jgi:hypothetical protein
MQDKGAELFHYMFKQNVDIWNLNNSATLFALLN